MTNSNLRTENHFDYVKITLASPERVMEWGQRTLPNGQVVGEVTNCLLYTSPSPRDMRRSRMPSSA